MIPFFQLGKKNENIVIFKNHSTIELKIKTSALILPNVYTYFQMKLPKNSKFTLKSRKIDHEFSKVIIAFMEPTDYSFIKNTLGFKGQFYSIPYAGIDFSKGHAGGSYAEIGRMYCAFSSRLEDMHIAAEKNKKFEGSGDELNLPESNSEEVMASLDPSFKI